MIKNNIQYLYSSQNVHSSLPRSPASRQTQKEAFAKDSAIAREEGLAERADHHLTRNISIVNEDDRL
jgi:hypothetical protein